MNKLVRKPNRTLAQQLRDILVEQIRNGMLRPGDKVASERELTRQYGVSRATVRNTVLGLAAEGLVTRSVGSGTYVVPDAGTRAALEGETGTIGLLVGRQHVPVHRIRDDFYYYKVMEGVQVELAASRQHLLFSYLDDDEQENARIVAGLEGKVDGVLLAEAGSSRLVEEIHARGLPCVLINPSIEDIDQRFDSLGVNNRSGAHKAIAFLAGLGHRRIGCLRGPAASQAAQDRFDGYCRALSEAGIGFDASLVVEVEGWTAEEGAAAARGLQARRRDFTALFCASDTLALGAMAVLGGAAVVPGRISVIGFDDISLASHSVPPLTTVRSPTFELGRLAGRQLLARIRNPSLLVSGVLLSPDLVTRQTCAAPRAERVGQ